MESPFRIHCDTSDESNPVLMLRNYFDNYIMNSVLGIRIERQVYKDFQEACITQNLKNDDFLKLVDKNYYKSMVLEIAKLFDPKKYPDDRNFRDFIDQFKKNMDSVLQSRKAPVLSLDTGKTRMHDCRKMVEPDFDKVKHDANIRRLEALCEEFKTFRDKKLCHSTSAEIENSKIPTMDDIDGAIDILNELVVMYAKLFGSYIWGGRVPVIYFNPLLSPKIQTSNTKQTKHEGRNIWIKLFVWFKKISRCFLGNRSKF